MKRATPLLLTFGLLLFMGVLVSQGLPAVMVTLSAAGWGLLAVAAFHALPLALDAAAIWVLFEPPATRRSLAGAVLTRWVGESANSLMPAGQLGGPVLMVRHLAHTGTPVAAASAAITVSTTLQTLAQILFALTGVLLLGAVSGHLSQHALAASSLAASAILGAQVVGFYLLQRRGLFRKLSRVASRLSGKRDWSRWVMHAESIDLAVEAVYGRGGAVAASFLLSLLGWLVGAAEVFLLLHFLGHPVSWTLALLLESLGQAIRGAAFAVPGALGIQEGGYVLLAPFAGLSPDTALALSLGKRTRELLLGVPGLLYLRFHARTGTE